MGRWQQALALMLGGAAAAMGEITISHVTVLLPHNIPNQQWGTVNFRLEAHGGCFDWSSNNEHVVSVTPVEASRCMVDGEFGYTAIILNNTEQCVQEGVELGRQSAWVMAEDLTTGQTVESEVFVDRVHRLEILTSTRRISCGDTETLDVLGFDNHDNAFSSLEGMPFQWGNNAEHILGRLTFGQAAVNVTEVHERMESEGISADRIPVKGMLPGKANVTARLLDPANPVHTTVEFLVTEPLYLLPTLARVAPCAELEFVLMTRSRDGHHRREPPAVSAAQAEYLTHHIPHDKRIIAMPTQQYKWSSSDTYAVSVDQDLGLASGVARGLATVTVGDVNLPEHRQEAKVYVSEPARLELRLTPIGGNDGNVNGGAGDDSASFGDDSLSGSSASASASSSSASASAAGGSARSRSRSRSRATRRSRKRRSESELRVKCKAPRPAQLSEEDVLKRAVRGHAARTAAIAEGKDEAAVAAAVAAVYAETEAAFASSTSDGNGVDAWFLVEDQEVMVEVLMYDDEGRLMDIAPNVRFNVTLNGLSVAYVPTVLSSCNVCGETDRPPALTTATPAEDAHFQVGAAFTLRAMRAHLLSSISVSIAHVTNTRTAQACPLIETLEASASLYVTKPVQLQIPEVVLPFTGEPHSFSIAPSGGSGRMVYTSSASGVANVASGVIVSGAKGSASVTVQDGCNPENRASIPVHVSPVGPLYYLASRREVEVGCSIELPVGVVDEHGRRFSNCSGLAVLPTVQQGRVTVSTQSSSDGPGTCSTQCPRDSDHSCFLLSVRGLGEGFAEVRSRLLQPDGAADKEQQHFGYASRVLSVFKPLHVEPESLLLAIGSQAHLTIGADTGPLPWPAAGFNSDTPLVANQGGVEVRAREGANMHCHLPTVTTLTSSAVARPPRGDWEPAATCAVMPYAPDSFAQMLVEDVHDGGYVTIQRSEGQALSPDSVALATDECERGLDALRHFRVSCLELTPYAPRQALAVDVRRGNTPSRSLASPVVSSRLVLVECLPRLSLQGEGLNLGVGSHKPAVLLAEAGLGAANNPKYSSEALLRDHPLLQNITYWTEHPDIATVNALGVVTGVSLGRTMLHARVAHPSLEGVSAEDDGLHAIAPVTVQFDQFRIALPCEGATLLQGKHTTAHVEGVNGEIPSDSSFSFVETVWHVDSSVVELLPPLTRTGHVDVAAAVLGTIPPQPRIHGPSLRIAARSPGRATITATVRVRSPGRHGVEEVVTRIITREVMVVEPLRLESRDALLLPPGALSVISTSLDDAPGFETTYQVLSDCGDNSGIVSVDARGVVTASRRLGAEGDAVVLVTSKWISHSQNINDNNVDDCGEQAGPIRTVQTVSVRVSVRRASQLSLSPSRSLSGPLCVGSNVTAEVLLQDALGRNFDSIEGWVGWAQQSESAQDDESETPVPHLSHSVNDPRMLRVQQRSSHRGRDPADGRIVESEAGAEQAQQRGRHDGVVAQLSLTALASHTPSGPHAGSHPEAAEGEHRSGSSAVVRLGLDSQPTIRPLYFRVYVEADADACQEPPSVKVVMRMRRGSLPVAHTSVRKRWAAKLQQDLASTLQIPAQRVALTLVEQETGYVHFHILPAHRSRDLHTHQWQLAEPVPAADVERTVPIHLAQALQAQLTDSSSALRSGAVSYQVDPEFALVIRSSREADNVALREAAAAAAAGLHGGVVTPDGAQGEDGEAGSGPVAVGAQSVAWLEDVAVAAEPEAEAAEEDAGDNAEKEAGVFGTAILTAVAVLVGLVYLYQLCCFGAGRRAEPEGSAASFVSGPGVSSSFAGDQRFYSQYGHSSVAPSSSAEFR